MRARRSTGLAVAAALAVALAACSSTVEPAGSTSPATAAGPGTGSTQTPSGTTAPTGAAAPSTTAPTGSGTEAPTGEPIPTDAVDYADALVVAWGLGDAARMAQLAVPEVVDVLGDAGGPNWERVAADSGAGSTFVTYEDNETGETLELRVQIQTASNGEEHAVVEAKRGTEM